METLIFNGSPRKNGDTVSLIRALKEFLPGKVTVVDACFCNIAPCTDCRFCWERPGCCQKDGWEQVERALLSCGGVVIASPVWFSELTGPLLSVLSRLQQYYCARQFRGEKQAFPEKRGGVLLVGGGDGSPERAGRTAEVLLRQMNCREIAPAVCCHNTNAVPALEEPHIKEKLAELARFLTAGAARAEGEGI